MLESFLTEFCTVALGFFIPSASRGKAILGQGVSVRAAV